MAAVVAAHLGQALFHIPPDLAILQVFQYPRQCRGHGGVGIRHGQREDLPGLGHGGEKVAVNCVAVLFGVVAQMFTQFPHNRLS